MMFVDMINEAGGVAGDSVRDWASADGLEGAEGRISQGGAAFHHAEAEPASDSRGKERI